MKNEPRDNSSFRRAGLEKWLGGLESCCVIERTCVQVLSNLVEMIQPWMPMTGMLWDRDGKFSGHPGSVIAHMHVYACTHTQTQGKVSDIVNSSLRTNFVAVLWVMVSQEYCMSYNSETFQFSLVYLMHCLPSNIVLCPSDSVVIQFPSLI